MNTIKRPRKRPRKHSVSFKTLGWLLIREAYLRIAFHAIADPKPALRRYVLEGRRSDNLQRWAGDYITRYPERRYFP
jgi:hypothetical protein